MKFILSFVENLPYIPDQYNVLIAQIASAVLFVFVLCILARFSTWFCNTYLSKLVAKLHSDKWFNAMREHRFLPPLAWSLRQWRPLTFTRFLFFKMLLGWQP